MHDNESDLELISDIQLEIAGHDEILASAGFGDSGEILRFLDAWADCLERLHTNRRPSASVFVLRPVPKGKPVSRPPATRMRALITGMRAAQLEQKILLVDLDANVCGSFPLSPDLRRLVQGGKWTRGQASRLSYGKLRGQCVCWVSNLSFCAYVNGAEALGFKDVVDRTLESADQTLNRQGWRHGELLRLCGDEDLCRRTRSGIWHFPDQFVLKRAPEEIIQERLDDFLRSRLEGFRCLQREHRVAHEGRVDLWVMMVDGIVYIVEVKWIGRSIKKKDEHKTVRELSRSLNTWACAHVVVLEEDNAVKGVSQLGYYLERARANKGYLVVYDCRPEAYGSGKKRGVPDYPVLEDPAVPYDVFHVVVDPRSASDKASDLKKR